MSERKPWEEAWSTDERLSDRSDTSYVTGPRWQCATPEVMSDDAYLIAAAPELYRALAALVATTEGPCYCAECQGERTAEMREAFIALDKARGGEPE